MTRCLFFWEGEEEDWLLEVVAEAQVQPGVGASETVCSRELQVIVE